MPSEHDPVLPPNATARVRSAVRHAVRLSRKIARWTLKRLRKTARWSRKTARGLFKGLRKTARRVRAQLRFAVDHVACLLSHCPLPLPWFPSMRRRDQLTQLFRLAAQEDVRDRSLLSGIDFLLFSALWPIVSGVQTLSYVWRFGQSARSGYGVSIGRQILRCWRLAAVHGIAPEQFYTFRPFIKGRVDLAPYYIQHEQIVALHRHLNAGTNTSILDSKILFHRFCRNHGLPCVPIFAIFQEDGQIFWLDVDPDFVPRVDLFFKPDDWWRGIGSELWHRDPENSTWSRGEQTLDQATLLQHFAKLASGTRDHLLFDCIIGEVH